MPRPRSKPAVRLRLAAPVLAGATLWLGASADAGPCEPWPGEPAPLPSVSSSDPALADWARRRAGELAALAAAASAPGDAARMWRHALCLDPEDGALQNEVLRSAPVRVLHPEIRSGARAASGDPDAVSLETVLAGPIVVRAGAPGPPPSPGLAAADAALGEAESLVRGARFEEALDAAGRAEQAAAQTGDLPAARRRVARAAVAAATAEIALDKGDDAVASLRRALAADPNLRLDPKRTSPKLLRALETARGGGGTQ